MDLHKEFIELTEWFLRSDELDADGHCPDPHQILACATDSENVDDLMENVPEERIGEVLAWAMNVDIERCD